MKKISLVLLVMACLILHSCKDDDATPEPTPCNVASYTLNTDSLAYHHDADGKLIEVTGARSVKIAYNNDQVASITEGDVLWDISYNGTDHPKRISVSKTSNPTSYIDLEYSGTLISSFSYINLSGDTMVQTLLFYDSNGGLDSMVRLEYDPPSQELFPLFIVHNVEHDGKTNPFSTQEAMRLLHLEDPISIGNFNVSRANFTVLGTDIEVNFTLTYDQRDRLIESVAVFDNPQAPENRARFTYTCE